MSLLLNHKWGKCSNCARLCFLYLEELSVVGAAVGLFVDVVVVVVRISLCGILYTSSQYY